MSGFLNALSFLTTIRFHTHGEFNAPAMVRHFSSVGYVIGAGLVILFALFGDSFIFPVAGLIFITAITGALHLDGFIDSADALFSHRSRERKLEIMKDPNTGAMGVVAVILLLLTKFTALSHLNSWVPLLLVPVYARFAMVISITRLPYVRKEGLGKGFFDDLDDSILYQIVPAVIILLIFTGFGFFFWFHLTFGLIVLALLTFYNSSIGGLTGDLLGATCETVETLMLLFSAYWFCL